MESLSHSCSTEEWQWLLFVFAVIDGRLVFVAPAAQIKTRSFVTRQDAENWSRSVETEIDRGSRCMPSQANKLTLGELIDRYMVEVLPSMKGAQEDAIRLKAIRRNGLLPVSKTLC